MNIKSLTYTSKYLPTNIVEQCFRAGHHTLVNKTDTGNGFTTAFLKSKTERMVNVIIVPNTKVVESKQASYNIADGVRIGFIYGGKDSDRLNFQEYDVLMFVVDSFLNYIERILENRDVINKILIDECHSMIIQSPFRHRLIGFQKFITEKLSDKAIVSVTATPMLFQKVDINITKEKREAHTINISSNQSNTLERIKTSLANKDKCIVALQDARILKHLLNDSNVLEANIKVGKRMLEKIVESVKVKLNVDSNLTIISSAGFEGFDVDNGINKVYIFEDRAFDYQTFFTQNIIQVKGRSRKGVSYIEWNRLPNNSRTELPKLEAIMKKVNSKKISNERKMTDKNYTYIRDFFTPKYDMNLGLIDSFDFNEDLFYLAKELQDADLKGLSIYDEFFQQRGISINYLNDGNKRLKLRTPSHSQAFKMVKENRNVVQKFNLFSNVKLDLYPKDTLEQYIKSYEVYLRRKYWTLDELPFLKKEIRLGTDFDRIIDASNFNRETNCLSYLKNEDGIDEAVRVISREAKRLKKTKVRRDSDEYKKWEADYDATIKDKYIRLLMAMSLSKISIPNKIRNHRNFNLMTEVSIDLISEVSEEVFERDLREIDIVSCNIRIIYAVCNLDLPANFYGEDKKNKKAINTLLNKLSKDHPISYKTNPTKWKSNRIMEMKKYNFAPAVIDFLISEFWNRPKDALYNFCAYHEEKICNQLMTEMIKEAESNAYEFRMLRRHDSVLLIGDGSHEVMNHITNNFEYLGVKQWFEKEVEYDLKMYKNSKSVQSQAT